MKYVEAQLFVYDLEGIRYKAAYRVTAKFRNKADGDDIYTAISNHFYEGIVGRGYVPISQESEYAAPESEYADSQVCLITDHIERFSVNIFQISKQTFERHKRAMSDAGL